MKKCRTFLTAFILAAFVAALSASSTLARDIHDTASFAGCMAEGNQCLADGKSKAECEAVVESCLEAADNKEREDSMPIPPMPYSPRALKESCVALIDDCFKRTLAMETCVVSTYRCDETRPAENCCPRGCIDKYKELTAKGTSDFEAFFRVFKHDAYSCFSDR